MGRSIAPIFLTILVVFGEDCFGATYSNFPDSKFWVTTGEVRTIAVEGGIVYVGGTFSAVQQQGQSSSALSRKDLAAFDLATGQPTLWNPSPSGGGILQVAAFGGLIYVAGGFSSIGGAQRNSLAALDPTTGNATAWNPDVVGGVLTMTFSGNTIFIGGSFTSVAGISREGLAAIDLNTGQLLPWNPGSVNGIRAMAASGGQIFVCNYSGGNPTDWTIGSRWRKGLAQLRPDSDIATDWDPAGGGSAGASDMVIADGQVWMSGGITDANGINVRRHLMAFDLATGDLSPWDPDPNLALEGMSLAIAKQGNVFAGGYATDTFFYYECYLVELDPVTGADMGWLPASSTSLANGRIYSLAATDDYIFVGGNFSKLGGVARDNFAVFPKPRPPVITMAPTASGKMGNVFRHSATATNPPINWSSVGNPPGVYYDSSISKYSGIPTQAGVYTVQLTATNLDGSDTKTVVITIASNATINVTPTSGLLTNERGHSASFNVVLSAAPSSNVTVPLSSSDTTEGTVSPSSLTFTPANWNVPQTVTVTGVDDRPADGSKSYTIVVGQAVSTDTNFDGLDSPDVSVTNLDDEFECHIKTSFDDLTLTQGQTVTFTVTATSFGGLESANLQIKRSVPAGLTFVSASTARGTYDNTTKMWTLGRLTHPANHTLTVQYTADRAGTIVPTWTDTTYRLHLLPAAGQPSFELNTTDTLILLENILFQ